MGAFPSPEMLEDAPEEALAVPGELAVNVLAPDNIDAWRKERRRELLARREALSLEDRHAGDERVARLLAEGFPLLAGLTIGFYWPFKGEVDPRVALHRLRKLGARTALPVVVVKASPLQFREWRPDTVTAPGVFGLPVPQGTAVVSPEAVLVPPVGFDTRGYRLGYGGGYFDRTLAAATPRPLAIALAREASRMETIHPQPYDIPMDFVITEDGIHAACAEGLRRLGDRREAAALARALLDARRKASPG
jgi:5,10-methenyltetrahydrofolate synthetase